jgi:hypothetical protein
MSRRPKTTGKVPDGEEFGVDWASYADGMPHRLKRKRDFPDDIDARTAARGAMHAAKRLNMAVQAVPDTGRHRSSYLWVLFADYEIPLGEPCRCGGRQIVRFHQLFGRCAACNAQILFADTDPNADAQADDDPYKQEERRFGWA